MMEMSSEVGNMNEPTDGWLNTLIESLHVTRKCLILDMARGGLTRGPEPIKSFPLLHLFHLTVLKVHVLHSHPLHAEGSPRLLL